MTEQLVNLKPEDILVADNVRFGLHPFRLERLQEQILKDGGVNTPIEVQPLDTPVDGKKYRLTVGFYRTTAVQNLNRDQKAGLTLPARVQPVESEAARMLRQVSENNERENMSPMDKAVAMSKMIAAGVTKMDLRNAFASIGGRKGNKITPVSNSHINMTLSFLDFPKDTQAKIHDGRIGVQAAYQLARYPKDKWAPILERAEKERLEAVEADEKAEAKYLEVEKKQAAADDEAKKSKSALDEAKKLAEESAKAAEAKSDAEAEAYKATRIKGLDKEARKAADAAFKSAKAEADTAKKVAEEKAKALAKVQEAAKKTADKAQAAKDRLEALRNKAKAAKKTTKTDKPIGGKDITKAAKKEGATTTTGDDPKPVKLNANEMREACRSLILLNTTGAPKTRALGEALIACFDGKLTDGQLNLAVGRLLGERDEKGKLIK